MLYGFMKISSSVATVCIFSELGVVQITATLHVQTFVGLISQLFRAEFGMQRLETTKRQSSMPICYQPALLASF